MSRSLSDDRFQYVCDHLDRYVGVGRIPCAAVLITHKGNDQLFYATGYADQERKAKVSRDSIFRIYSMTKPITSVALLKLYERGHFQLDDPVAKHIPAWENLRVYVSGEGDDMETTACDEPMTIKHLMTHTSGLTYGFMNNHPVDELYREMRLENGEGQTLDSLINGLARVPLLFQPGTKWSYSIATDVLGYLVEHFSGQSFDEFLQEEITGPLGMQDTGFSVPDDSTNRFTACYNHHPDGYRLQDDPINSRYLSHPTFLSGGGGLVSTIDDYNAFAQNLLGHRQARVPPLLGAKTVEYMTSNHLPGNSDLAGMGQRVFSETSFEGVGFGLSGSVVIDPPTSSVTDSVGCYGWGGAASTYFWNDPKEDITTVFMTQLLPSSTWPIRRELKVLVNQLLVD